MVRETGQGMRWPARAPSSGELQTFNSAQIPFTFEMFRVRDAVQVRKTSVEGWWTFQSRPETLVKAQRRNWRQAQGADGNSPEEELG